MGKEFLVDQDRKIIITPGNPEYWTEQDNSWSVSNKTPPACLFLSSVIGSTRYLSVEGFMSILSRICAGEPWPAISESGLANFLNLTVSEKHARVHSDVMIWVTVAHELTLGREETNIHEVLPELITDHDTQHTPGDPHILFSEKLAPGESTSFDGTYEEYEEQLVDAVLSTTARSSKDPFPHGETSLLLKDNLQSLSSYVQNTVFTRVVKSLG